MFQLFLPMTIKFNRLWRISWLICLSVVWWCAGITGSLLGWCSTEHRDRLLTVA